MNRKKWVWWPLDPTCKQKIYLLVSSTTILLSRTIFLMFIYLQNKALGAVPPRSVSFCLKTLPRVWRRCPVGSDWQSLGLVTVQFCTAAPPAPAIVQRTGLLISKFQLCEVRQLSTKGESNSHHFPAETSQNNLRQENKFYIIDKHKKFLGWCFQDLQIFIFGCCKVVSSST